MQVDTLSVQLLQAAASHTPGSYLASLQPENSVQVMSYDARFSNLMGNNISATLTDQQSWDFVYGAFQLMTLSVSIRTSLILGCAWRLSPVNTVHLCRLPNDSP